MILQSWKERAQIGRNRRRWILAVLFCAAAALCFAVFLAARLKWK